MRLKNVSIGYSAPVVTAIDAELLSGEFICLIGRNGSGKSTLLKTLAGLLKPLSGMIENESGSRLKRVGESFKTSRGVVFEHVGIVLTDNPNLQNTTVFELASYGRIPHLNLFAKLRQEDIDAVNNAIETVGITALRDRKTCELSDGERQKAMIARALAQGTDILLLDEPSAFLDYQSKHELMQLLVGLAHDNGKTIVLSSHDLDIVKTYADKVWEIKNGELYIISAAKISINNK